MEMVTLPNAMLKYSSAAVAPLRNGPGKQQAVGGGMGEYPTRTGQAEVETDG